MMSDPRLARLVVLIRAAMHPPLGARRIALALTLGILCHAVFAAAVLTKITAMFFGLSERRNRSGARSGTTVSPRGLILLALAAYVLLALGSSPMPATATTIEDFAVQPETRWRLITDQVMGGVSSGQIVFAQENGRAHARLTGRVSTANRGGFIQMRLNLAGPPPDGTTGVRLVVRGNEQRYFVHLRTATTVRPWEFYQAGFEATRNWNEVRLPLDAFVASRRLAPAADRLDSPTSLAVVAYGRDHEAEIEVSEVGFY